jgi:D-alanine transaminase
VSGLLAWVDGAVVPLVEARVSVLDQGFRTGEGVFETIRVYAGHPFRLGAHLDRAAAGAERLGFVPPDHAHLRAAVHELVAANAGVVVGDLGLRLTLTGGPLDPDSPFPGRPLGRPTVVATVQPLAIAPGIYARGITAAVVPWARELPEIKAVSYLAASLARARARELGADEALLTAGHGVVLEGAASNVFAVVDGGLVTPPLDAGLLAGVTRGVVLELAAAAGMVVRERLVTVRELCAAAEVFLTASTRELVPLVSIDGEPVGNGAPGPVTQRLLAAYRAEVARERAAATPTS